MALGSAEKDLDSYDMFEGEALTQEEQELIKELQAREAASTAFEEDKLQEPFESSDDLDEEEEKTVLKFIEKQKLRQEAMKDEDYEEVFGFEDEEDAEMYRKVQEQLKSEQHNEEEEEDEGSPKMDDLNEAMMA